MSMLEFYFNADPPATPGELAELIKNSLPQSKDRWLCNGQPVKAEMRWYFQNDPPSGGPSTDAPPWSGVYCPMSVLRETLESCGVIQSRHNIFSEHLLRMGVTGPTSCCIILIRIGSAR